jgi:hypothetical protein
MNEILSKVDGSELIGLVAVAGGLLCGILCGVTAIIAGAWEKVRLAEMVAALKQDMLNRGMSADEIRTVVETGSKSSRRELKRMLACKDSLGNR